MRPYIGNFFCGEKPEDAYVRWVRQFLEKTKDMDTLGERFEQFTPAGKRKTLKHLTQALKEKQDKNAKR